MSVSRVAFLVACLVLTPPLVAAPKPLALAGEQGRLYRVAFSPDGKLLASGGEESFIRVWDVATGKELRRLGDPQQLAVSAAWSLAFSPDGALLSLAGAENEIILFDPATGGLRGRLRGHTHIIWATAFSPDGRHLASASADRTVRIWDRARGMELRRLPGQVDPWCLEYSPCGRFLAVGDSRGVIVLYDAATGREVRRWKAHDDGGVWPLAYSPDGRSIASVSWLRGSQRLFETATGKERARLQAANAVGWAVAFAPDGRTVYGCGDRAVLAWDLRAGQAAELPLPQRQPGGDAELRQPPPLGRPGSVAVSADGRLVAAGEHGPVAYLWRLDPPPPRRRPLTPQEAAGHWEALAAADAARAYQAILALADDPERALPLLRAGAAQAAELKALRAVEVLQVIGSAEAQAVLEDLARSDQVAVAAEAEAALRLLRRR
jgi:WD40 repeat protein